MAARKTKLIIYKGEVPINILYVDDLFTTIIEIQQFLAQNGYNNFTEADLQYILDNQMVEEDTCCQALTPITPEFEVVFTDNNTASVTISNYDIQDDENTYYIDVVSNNIVVQSIPITSGTLIIEDLLQSTIYTFRVYSVTCSNKIYVDQILQTPPILLTISVIGQGTSPQAIGGSQIHEIISGDDFYIEFNGGVVNTNELWYYQSVTRDNTNIQNLVTFTEIISTKNTDGNFNLLNIVQDSTVIITFINRTATWCADPSCVSCNEFLEQATLTVLNVYENSIPILGSPFTITVGADPQVIADTYFISLELATELISNQIVDSTGVCCFEDPIDLTSLIVSSISETSFDYSFTSTPLNPQYTLQIRRQPTNQLIQSSIITGTSGTITGLLEDTSYSISIQAANCAGSDFIIDTLRTLVSCTEVAPILNPIQVFPRDVDFALKIQASTSSVYTGDYIFQFYGGKGFYLQVISSNGYYEAPEGTFPSAREYQLITSVSNCAGSDQNDETILVESLCFDLPIGALNLPVFADSPSSGIIRIIDMSTTGGHTQNSVTVQFRAQPFTGSNLVVATIDPTDCPRTFGIGGDEEFIGFGFPGFIGQYEVFFSYTSCNNSPQVVSFSTLVNVLP